MDTERSPEQNQIHVNGQLTKIHRLETIKTATMIFLAIGMVILGAAIFYISRTNDELERRLACRGRANETIQLAVGKAFVAAIHNNEKQVEVQADEIERGVDQLERCE